MDFKKVVVSTNSVNETTNSSNQSINSTTVVVSQPKSKKRGRKKKVESDRKCISLSKEEIKELLQYRLKSTIKNYDVETLLNKIENGTIIIPQFQRESNVWSNYQKGLLIYSIITGKGIGTLTIVKDGNDELLLDGLQRVSTIKQFIENELTLKFRKQDFERLENEKILQYLNNKKFEDLPQEIQKLILNFDIPIKIVDISELSNNKKQSTIIELFELINTQSTKLTPYELLYASLHSSNEVSQEKLEIINEFAENIKIQKGIKKDRKRIFGVLLRILAEDIFLRKNTQLIVEPQSIPQHMNYKKFIDWLRDYTKRILEDKDITTDFIEQNIEQIIEIYSYIENSYNVHIHKSHYYIEFIPVISVFNDILMLYFDKKFQTVPIGLDEIIEFVVENIISPTLTKIEELEDIDYNLKDYLKNGEKEYLLNLYKEIHEFNNVRDTTKVIPKKLKNIMEIFNILLKSGYFYNYYKDKFVKNGIEENPFENWSEFKKFINEELSINELILL